MRKKRYLLHRAVWIFTAACIVGFLMESLESQISLGYVQNRQGLLYGPFTPIYGTGALIFALCRPIVNKRRWPAAFLITMLSGTLLEFLWSYGQERLFGAVFWDYQHIPFQLDGRINLLFALCWGVLGVLFLRKIYLPFCRFIAKLPRLGRGLVTWVLIVLMTGDILLSSWAFFRQRERQNAVAADSRMQVFLDEVYPDERLKEQFPTMQIRAE